MIRLDDVQVSAGTFALRGVNLHVGDDEHVLLLGPTGRGKTTLLEVIAGLRPITGGRVWIDGRDVTKLPPRKRGVAYVPQDGALFRHLTVAGNLAFAGASAAQARNMADRLGVAELLDRGVRNLSGGEAQRVAIGRALLRPGSGVLLLDEPTAALDGETRQRVIELIRERADGRSVLHVTHDASLASTFAARTVTMAGIA